MAHASDSQIIGSVHNVFIHSWQYICVGDDLFKGKCRKFLFLPPQCPGNVLILPKLTMKLFSLFAYTVREHNDLQTVQVEGFFKMDSSVKTIWYPEQNFSSNSKLHQLTLQRNPSKYNWSRYELQLNFNHYSRTALHVSCVVVQNWKWPLSAQTRSVSLKIFTTLISVTVIEDFFFATQEVRLHCRQTHLLYPLHCMLKFKSRPFNWLDICVVWSESLLCVLTSIYFIVLADYRKLIVRSTLTSAALRGLEVNRTSFTQQEKHKQ